ncbi:hypothetical protein NFI96_016781, partial [Prochilodus magdalenae]
QQPDPNQPKPEGVQMSPLHGEPLGVVTNWPPSLLASLQRWGTTQPKSPCLTALDNAGKPVYTLTYGKLWTRSQKLAYTLLNKLSSRNEPLLRPGDRVALVFPNNDPVMFMVAFYGCLLAELVPVPIEVPLTRKDAGSQQIGFLLGSCGVTLALTTDACQKGLPKAQTGEVATFKGWPRLLWFVTDGKHVVKPPKDWTPLIRDASNETAYIEYKTSKEGSTMGITVSHAAMLAHSHALTQACGYTEGETITNVLDFKRDAGLWHGVLTSVMNRMHVISIPYSLMKVNPLSWIQKVHTYKARVAVVKSRDMHWSLLSQKDQRDISLSSLRMLIVADGANPWSISSCDAFLNVFQARGLRPEVICPCASSAEAMTVALRRPPEMGVPPPGKAVLSMSCLSHGVIRVDTEEKLSVLTLQDVGQVMPGALVCVVRPEGTPYLCRTDEVGEICVSSCTTGVSYYGLPGMTKNVFETIPVTASGSPVSDRPFTRSSLLGFIGPDNLLFVVGKMDGLMVVSGRRHNADDVVATALAVEPMKFVYRGRIAVFSVCVLHDERIVVVAEQRPDASEEDSFQWMSRVLQAIDSIHQVGVYCLALVPANTLPKAPLGGIHISETKQRFLEGALHPCNVLMCPHTCVTNLPKPRQKQPEVGPASMIVGNLVAGKRIAQACGRDVAQLEDNDQARKFLYMQDVLQWRAQATPDHPLFLVLNAKGTVASTATCVQLHKRAERVAVALMERGRLNTGDHVALVYPPGIDLIATFYGCLYAGCVPVTVRPPHPQNLATTLPTVKMIVEVSKSVCILTTQAIMKLLKSKEAAAAVDVKTWPMVLDTDDLPRKKLPQIYKPPTPEMLAYLDFSVSTTGILAGVKMSHAATSALCRSIKLQCELYPSRQIAICLDPYCGLGFALWCLCSVYSGHQSILVPPLELESNVSLWLSAVSQFKVRVTFCSYSVMEMCTKGLGSQTEALRLRNVNLSCVRTCMVVAEERPRIALTQSFSKIFKDLGLSPRAVSTTFGCRVNVAICLQLEHPHTVPADGAVGVEVEGHQAFWTCDNKPSILVLTTVPPHTDSLGVSTKTKAGLGLLYCFLGAAPGLLYCFLGAGPELLYCCSRAALLLSQGCSRGALLFPKGLLYCCSGASPGLLYCCPRAALLLLMSCSTAVPGLLYCCSRAALLLSQGCSTVAQELLYCCPRAALLLLKGLLYCCSRAGPELLYCCSRAVLLLLQGCSTAVPGLLYCCSGAALLLSQGCSTVAHELLYCCPRAALLLLKGLLYCCSRAGPELLYCCSRAALLLLQGCSIAAPGLLHCCDTLQLFASNHVLLPQGTAGPDPTTVYVDMRALRHDRVRLVERGSPHSLPLMESGKILPGVKVIIANTETKGPLGDSHLGEIWVSSPHNATGYYTVYGEEALHADHFCTKLSFGDTQTVWARTGYLGFLRRTELTDASGERHDALYVVGSLDETLELRGMRYHPIDIETSVIRAHKSIAECAVFTWTNLLVVVVELEGSEQEALDLVALVTNVVLEEHFLIVGVVVVVDPGVIPINSRGEKQRMHLRDGFLADQLDPIYVAYNM